jgi:hypothetical protein
VAGGGAATARIGEGGSGGGGAVVGKLGFGGGRAPSARVSAAKLRVSSVTNIGLGRETHSGLCGHCLVDSHSSRGIFSETSSP